MLPGQRVETPSGRLLDDELQVAVAFARVEELLARIEENPQLSVLRLPSPVGKPGSVGERQPRRDRPMVRVAGKIAVLRVLRQGFGEVLVERLVEVQAAVADQREDEVGEHRLAERRRADQQFRTGRLDGTARPSAEPRIACHEPEKGVGVQQELHRE
jgi:hypothetical protein